VETRKRKHGNEPSLAPRKKSKHSEPSLLDRFETLPLELQCEIARHTDLSSKSQLAQTCRGFNSLFQPCLNLTKLLRHIARRIPNKVMKMLASNSDLVLLKGEVTDYADRTFKNISPLQLAAWYLDTDMLKLLFNFLREDQKQLAWQQLEALDQYGTEYGSHYDFSPLITGLLNYVNNYASIGPWIRGEYLRDTVGQVQRGLPVHVANEYCRPYRSSPHFNTMYTRQHLPYISHVPFCDAMPWFSQGLSSHYAISWAEDYWPNTWDTSPASARSALDAMTTLYRVKIEELAKLKQQLLSPSQDMEMDLALPVKKLGIKLVTHRLGVRLGDEHLIRIEYEDGFIINKWVDRHTLAKKYAKYLGESDQAFFSDSLKTGLFGRQGSSPDKGEDDHDIRLSM
jgi:hypothetical protein